MKWLLRIPYPLNYFLKWAKCSMKRFSSLSKALQQTLAQAHGLDNGKYGTRQIRKQVFGKGIRLSMLKASDFLGK